MQWILQRDTLQLGSEFTQLAMAKPSYLLFVAQLKIIHACIGHRLIPAMNLAFRGIVVGA